MASAMCGRSALCRNVQSAAYRRRQKVGSKHNGKKKEASKNVEREDAGAKEEEGR